MPQNAAMEGVLQQLQAFKKKFYLNLLLKGLIFTGGLLVTFFVLYTLLEYFFYFPYYVRAFLFFSFLGLGMYSFWRWIFTPLTAFTSLRKLLSDEDAANRVGSYYPQIKDKLVNTIQLQSLSFNNDLIAASIAQKSEQFTGFQFSESIKLAENKPLLKYILVPMAIMLGITLIYPSLFVQGSERIIHYKKFYAPEAPFSFHVKNKNLQGFQHEDFTVNVNLEGKTIPEELTILYNGREQKLVEQKDGTYSFTFQKLQKPVTFQLAGGGFFSDEYNLEVLARPNLNTFSVEVKYPAYLKKPIETIRNTGNISVPEGSTVAWNFDASATEELALEFKNPNQRLVATPDDNIFTVSKKITASQEYAVKLKNKHSANKDEMNFMVSSIADRFPEISIENFQDTATFSYLVLGGSISDDYGLSRLSLNYRVANEKSGANSNYKSLPIKFEASQLSQTYYMQWELDRLNLTPGDRLEYFVQVWDNDGVHGAKSSRTRLFDFKIPTRQELETEMSSSAKSLQSQMSKSVEKSQKIKSELEKSEEKLKTKRDLTYQDKKQLEDLLDKKKQLQSDIEEMKKQFEQLNKQQDRFNQKSPELTEKTEQLKKLMNDLLDEETKKLFEELEKLLQQQQPDQRELQKILDKMDNKEKNLEKELERTLELFKQLQFENKLENTTKKLEELAKEEEKLAEKTEEAAKENPKEDKKENEKNKADQKAKDKENAKKNEEKKNDSKKDDSKNNPEDKNKEQSKENNKENQKDQASEEKKPNSELRKEQQELKKDFEEVKKDMQELKDLNKQLEEKNQMENTEDQEKEIEQDMQESEESLGKEQNKKASQAQKDAAQKMKEMAKKMQQQQESGESEEAQQSLDDLRDILENLITLSFDQEELMKSFRGVSQSDPRFITLGQQQLKLKDDAKIIEDSLNALAKKVFQIQSFVTREVGAMNTNIAESLVQIKERNTGKATSYQQLTMTSINNLALMLNDALKQMQQQMAAAAAAKSKPGKGKGKKGGKPKPGEMGAMQDALNQKIQDLKKGNQQGRGLSEELAKLAAQQQQLRNALRELEKQNKANGTNGQGEKLENLSKMMEQTETDLVNKRLTEQTIMRQREILTRLLEAEKSAKERDLDDKREAQTASEKVRTMPPSFEKYLKTKQKQTELLKTVSPALSPYYKKEVNEYFQKIGK